MKVHPVLFFLGSFILLTLVGCGNPTPPTQVRQEVKDAWVIAKKLIDHFGAEGLDQFTEKNPGEFNALIQNGVLTEEEGGLITRNGFASFAFSRSPQFSRRYTFTFDYVPGSHVADGLTFDMTLAGEPILER